MSRIRALVNIALQAKDCDTLVKVQEAEINAGLRLQMVSDSLLTVRTRELTLCRAESHDLDRLYTGQKELTRIAGKQKRKWIIIAVAGIGLAVVELVKGH